jgi:hypothetical protein
MIEEGRIFSCPDEYGEERYYCVTEILPSEYYEALFSAQGEAVKAMRAAKKASKNAWVEGKSGWAKNLKVGRNINSPFAMRDASWASDMGANALHTKISTKAERELARQAGTAGKSAFPDATNGLKNKKLYGGGYWA